MSAVSTIFRRGCLRQLAPTQFPSQILCSVNNSSKSMSINARQFSTHQNKSHNSGRSRNNNSSNSSKTKSLQQQRHSNPNISPTTSSSNVTQLENGNFKNLLYDGKEEILTPAEQEEKQKLIKELTRRLSGPLADEFGNVPTGDARPVAIEVDGPSHFYANSQRYTAYSKLKHRLLSRMGYKVLHVPYSKGLNSRRAGLKKNGGLKVALFLKFHYMRRKLAEDPSEWLDPEDEGFYMREILFLQFLMKRKLFHLYYCILVGFASIFVWSLL